MKLTENGKRDARDLQRLPASPVKLTRLLRLLSASVKELPLDANAPAPVSEAHKAYEAEAVRAQQAAGKVEAAEAEVKAAAIRDGAAAAEAMRVGKPTPKPSQAKAAEAVASALVETQGAGQLLEEAHDRLVDAVREAWPTWRAQLVTDAASAHAAAAGALEKAAAAVGEARSLYAGVASLDLGVLGRYPKIAEAVTAERRGGLEWYASTCGPTPLVSVDVQAILLAVAEPGDFTQAEWLPPGDPDHDALLNAPLDFEATWVKAAVRREWGSSCAVCHYPGADVVVEDEKGSGLVLVHAKCQSKDPDPKAKQRAERLAKMQRGGFPPSPNEATQIVGPSGRVHKDKDFNG